MTKYALPEKDAADLEAAGELLTGATITAVEFETIDHDLDHVAGVDGIRLVTTKGTIKCMAWWANDGTADLGLEIEAR